jgi:aminopeptidase N
MSHDTPSTIYLKDYLVPPFLIDKTELHFELGDKATLVRSKLHLRRNPDSDDPQAALQLHGDSSLVLRRLVLDGKDLSAAEYVRDDDALTLSGLPEQCLLECVTLIKPQENTSLEGLYRSNGMFCTQCEAEGFRKITFYLDRPDVMSLFTTTVAASKQEFPVLLSNGNPIAQGEQGARHWVTWEDPFKKPAYLFALVAGDLQRVDESFTTCSGRDIKLQLFVEPQNLDKCEHALASLKRAMVWDEQQYGREYDLDIFMIVAVDHFNMGAMENKGLNIFNSSCVLAKAETTTDAGFERIEGIVAHEYFHNWSGNRVTCRDWFQLSLKEGFTVFRDRQYSADVGSQTVKRIEDVSVLRTAQFAEDAGPMAHPIRPESYMEITNFYTLTIYEKGAEVVGMIHTLLGAELFRKGSDLYFERHDGQAVTTDDFVQAMEDASGLDLIQFRRWYVQAGTPRVEVTDSYNAAEQRYTLHMKQSCPATPGQPHKAPFHIPVTLGLLDAQGRDLVLAEGQTSQVLELVDAEQSFVFEGISSKPVPSLLRGFSAPVKLSYPYSRDELVLLMSHDSDGFNRWDAAQRLAVAVMQELIGSVQAGEALVLDPALIAAFTRVLSERNLDPAMVAKLLQLPSEAYLAELAEEIDPLAIHQVRNFVRLGLAQALEGLLLEVYNSNRSEGAYRFTADAAARRSLQNAALGYLMALDQPHCLLLAKQQFAAADNMTDSLTAMSLIVHSGFDAEREQVLQEFYQQWQEDPLVVNQWLGVQAMSPREDALEQVQQLMASALFDLKNPNRIRALIGTFCGQNAVQFHRGDGAGYRFLADRIIELDPLNPQIAARLLTPLTRWKRYSGERQQLMRTELERISAGELSKDSFEVVSKSLV